MPDQSFPDGPASSANAQRYLASKHPAGQMDSQSSNEKTVYQNPGYQPTTQEMESWLKQDGTMSGEQRAWIDPVQCSSYLQSLRLSPQQGELTYPQTSQVPNSVGPDQQNLSLGMNMGDHRMPGIQSVPHSAHSTQSSMQNFPQSARQQPSSDAQFVYPVTGYHNSQFTSQPLLASGEFSNLSAADLDTLNGYVFNMDPSWTTSMASPTGFTGTNGQTHDFALWSNGQVGSDNLLIPGTAAMSSSGYMADVQHSELDVQKQLWQIANPHFGNMQNNQLNYQDNTMPIHGQSTQTAIEIKQCIPDSNGKGNPANRSTANTLPLKAQASSHPSENDTMQAQYWNSNVYQPGSMNQLNLQLNPGHHSQISPGEPHQQQSNPTHVPPNSVLAPSTRPTSNSAMNSVFPVKQKNPQQQQVVYAVPQSLNSAQHDSARTSAYAPPLQQTHYASQPMQNYTNATAPPNPQFGAYAIPVPSDSINVGVHPAISNSAGYLKHTAITHHLGNLSLGSGEFASSHSIMRNLQQYMSTSSRYALGERRIVIHTPRVGQKSYGTEKRFLCPPPTASIIGLPWWQPEEDGKLRSPSINISLTGENSVPASMPFWTTVQNQVHEESSKLRLTAEERPFLGKVSNKSLHISDGTEPKEDKKPRNVKAVMAIHIRDRDGQPGTEIGSFESREIKIVSKPSKKRSSARTSELFLQHGTLVTLFNRIKAQTSTTKFLAISPNLRQFKGSDGKPLPLSPNFATTENGFIADQNSWDPFTIWLVDPNKPQIRIDNYPESDTFFPPPSDVITIPTSGVAPIICFNNTVRLQCQVTGLITPVMVIRKIDGPQTVQAFEGTRKENELSKCPVNEQPGDPVCQLHKIAFELYASPVAPHSPVYGLDIRSPGSWLSCDQEGIAFRPGISARTWMTAASTTSSRSSLQLSSSLPPSPGTHMSALQPMTPRSVTSHNLPSAPESPVNVYSPSFQAPSSDYFAARRQHNSASSTPYVIHSPLPTPGEDLTESNGPGPHRRRRTSSGASFASTRASNLSAPIMRPPPPRKRGSQQSIHGGERKDNEHDALLWTIDVSESATWTIVGAETKTYTFWIPPDVKTLSCPITPFPTLNKYIPPGVAAETGHNVDKRYPGQFTSLVEAPLATFYGSGLSKKSDGEPLQVVYYGTQPAKHNEVRCQEVMNASIPESDMSASLQHNNESVPIFLIKANGECIYPTPLTWKG